MSTMSNLHDLHLPKVILPEGFNEQQEAEMLSRGYLSHVLVEVEGHTYPIYFVDPVRLQQDLVEYVRLGSPYFAEPGLIVLPVMTIEAINGAVQGLWSEGFFSYLKPIESGPSE